MYDELVRCLRHCVDVPEHRGCGANCKYWKEHPVNYLCIQVMMQEAADAIEELSKRRWISVEERLPNKSGYYLIVTHLGLPDDAEDWMKDNSVDVTMAHYADYSNIWTTDSGAAYNADLSKCDKTRYEYVSHWMPLPSAPTEEKHDD